LGQKAHVNLSGKVKNMIETCLEEILKLIYKDYKIKVNEFNTISMRGLSKLCGIEESGLREHFKHQHSKLFQKLEKKGFSPKEFNKCGVPFCAIPVILNWYVEKGKSPVAKIIQGVFAELGFIIYCDYLFRDDNENKDKLLNTKKLVGGLSKIISEVEIKQKSKDCGAELLIELEFVKLYPESLRQVETPVGTIDVLTNDEVIEIKSAKQWKAALGQVLTYGGQYPNHKKRLHLFGTIENDKRTMVETECLKFNVCVTWHEDLKKQRNTKYTP
jgi:hypothetical protein